MDHRKQPMWLQRDTVGGTEHVNIAVGDASPGPEPVVHLSVWGPGSPQATHRLRLGETFPAGDETWRLADIDFENALDFSVCLRLVDANEPQDPPSGRLWEPAEFRPYGSATFAQLTAAEAQIGSRFPGTYRDWLMGTNGAQPVRPYRLPAHPFLVTPERPLFGLQPDRPASDLVAVQQTWRDPYLPKDYLVIATPGGAGGLLTVHGDGFVGWLSPDAMAGRREPRDRARLVKAAALDIDYFLASLIPYEPDAPPAEAVLPGAPGYRSWMNDPS